MASKGPVESLTEGAICPVCLDFFTDPVTLQCGHNFCRSCITRCWEREERNSCPECREVFPDRTLRASRALANLAETIRNLNLHWKAKESKLYCGEHEEELKLFCETDKTLICLICRDAQEHREHRFLPIKEAVKIYKDQLKSSLDSLTKMESDFQEKEQQQKEKISGVQKKSHSIQSNIASQFAELRQIITEKEQSLLRDLREEEARIINPMEKNLLMIEENITLIQEEISKLKERMDQKDSVIFLKAEACQNMRINDNIQELSVTDEAQPFEKFDNPYLLNTVLREAVDAVNRVSVTLDVETADSRLQVSGDRKSVRFTGTQTNLPDTEKRFTFWECVLGSEGFTSGRHYWEVEVTGNRRWCLGVAAESVERKGQVNPSPKTGFWIIKRYYEEIQNYGVASQNYGVGNWNYGMASQNYGMASQNYGMASQNYGVASQNCDVFSIHTSPESRLPASSIPGRLGVYLSYESGKVSFYNAETKSHIHTFTGNKFTGKLYPFFRTWDVNQWLRICSGSSPGV
ncbi:zinc-binding protein A33-like [Mobula birostris]|uniref:zinc-binding protein A33-like n=1 Tax=Mobula birostris TaxID=1983395 RepID=UPI003B289F12